ncbi:Gfo/Idh/MocA family oxidoreductase [Saccharopolyspora sp. K220]|uniref:Gfo/Idh/MocA family protein n=1 Tax=Saccharopolyspora soli TaxID=2926618 RepID=UPI001F55C8ED|nr:Gfo/Idh/MocA family oxidoreductase [Saccharopolyspora soli]MCI2424200.1 Gfo/Idh/MocA family oxidoreductase [Saccharopolyspora soli]
MTAFRTISGDRPLRLVLVGAGQMGQAWLRAIDRCPLVETVGVVDLDVAAAQAAAPPGAVAGDSLSEVVGRRAADAVVNVTVPAAHLPVTLEAFGLGLPVLGEKPLAATLPEAVALVRAAETAGELFMVSQNRRFHPGLWELKRQVARLGRVGVLAHEFFKAPRFGGFRDAMAHPLLLDMAIHNFDAARFLLDADPIAVYCEEYNPAWSWYQGDAATTAIFEMTGGARFVYTGSWCSPGLETSWNSEWRVSAEHGAARWDGAGDPQVESNGGGAERSVDGYPGDNLLGSLTLFVRALRTGQPPMSDGRDNIRSLAMVHAAIASAAKGSRVQVADVLHAAESEADTLGS